MRLIDADELTNWILSELRQSPNGVFNALNGRQSANLIGKAIDEMPTVDAIPVDWMLKRMNETALTDTELNNALFMVGVEWGKRNRDDKR